MSEVWPSIVTGLVTGSMYGLVACGLVLTYQTSGVFNFAHGSLAMLCAYAYYALSERLGLPTSVAAILTVGVFAPALALVLERIVFRRLGTAPVIHRIIGTVGLFVLLAGAIVVVFGSAGKRVPSPFPARQFELGSQLTVGADQIGVLVVTTLAGLGLFFFLRSTSTGTAILAVVDRRDVAALAGIDVHRVSRISWILGTMMAAVAGILLSPLVILDWLFFALLVIQALSGAMFGYLRSIPLALAGGVVVGLGESLLTKYGPSQGALIGVRSSFSFIVLFAVLVFYAVRGAGRGQARPVAQLADRVRAAGTARIARPADRAWARVAIGCGVALALVIPPAASPSWRFTLAATLPMVIVFLSMTVLTGYAGQISLCQAAFAGVGSVTVARVVGDTGMSFWLVLPLAGLAAVPFGLAVGLPALRLGGLHLALLTLGFGLLVDNMIFNNLSVTRGGAGLQLSRPTLFGLSLASDLTYYYVLLLFVALTVLLVHNLRMSPTGRALRAVQDSETGVRSVGLNPTAFKLAAFVLAAFLAGVGGALFTSVQGHFSALDFGMYQSLLILVTVVVAGVRTPAGGVVAALIYVAGPKLMSELPEPWSRTLPLWLGIAAVAGWSVVRARAGVATVTPRVAGMASDDGLSRLPAPLPRPSRPSVVGAGGA